MSWRINENRLMNPSTPTGQPRSAGTNVNDSMVSSLIDAKIIYQLNQFIKSNLLNPADLGPGRARYGTIF